jgi:hypothetical protein
LKLTLTALFEQRLRDEGKNISLNNQSPDGIRQETPAYDNEIVKHISASIAQLTGMCEDIAAKSKELPRGSNTM